MNDTGWRRGSESNRRPRLCRPLHDHSATSPLWLLIVESAHPSLERDPFGILPHPQTSHAMPFMASHKRSAFDHSATWPSVGHAL